MIRIPIKIGKKDYFIKTDKYNYMIGYEITGLSGKKKGEVVFIPESNHGNLGSCMSALLNMKVKASNVKTLEGLRRVIERSRKEVIEIYDTHMNNPNADTQ